MKQSSKLKEQSTSHNPIDTWHKPNLLLYFHNLEITAYKRSQEDQQQTNYLSKKRKNERKKALKPNCSAKERKNHSNMKPTLYFLFPLP